MNEEIISKRAVGTLETYPVGGTVKRLDTVKQAGKACSATLKVATLKVVQTVVRSSMELLRKRRGMAAERSAPVRALENAVAAEH